MLSTRPECLKLDLGFQVIGLDNALSHSPVQEAHYSNTTRAKRLIGAILTSVDGGLGPGEIYVLDV